MEYSGRLGGRGATRYGYYDGGRGIGRNPSLSHWTGRGPRASFSTRGNPLWSEPMDYEQAPPSEHTEERMHRDTTPGLDPEFWEQSSASKAALDKIVAITSENWHEQEFVECQWDFAEAALEVQKLQSHAMICYFTERAPLLQDFKEWISFELGTQRGWPTRQIKFLGKNFFLVHFDDPAHRDEALILAPWFMDHRFVYTFK
ncbi:unnamed protein product [Calypogeia fissa]